MSHADTVLEFLEQIDGGACDGCIRTRTGIEPHQTVNQTCRRLEQMGTVIRDDGWCSLCKASRRINSLRSNTSDEAGTRTRHVATRVAPAAPVASVSIEEMRNRFDRFCKALATKRLPSGDSAGLAMLISELSNTDIVPAHQASMMHTIRTLRNRYVHDHIEMHVEEANVAVNAWKIVARWAEEKEPELWQSSAR